MDTAFVFVATGNAGHLLNLSIEGFSTLFLGSAGSVFSDLAQFLVPESAVVAAFSPHPESIRNLVLHCDRKTPVLASSG